MSEYSDAQKILKGIGDPCGFFFFAVVAVKGMFSAIRAVVGAIGTGVGAMEADVEAGSESAEEAVDESELKWSGGIVAVFGIVLVVLVLYGILMTGSSG
jgi:predicted benzoate:H+ symporter BenE